MILMKFSFVLQSFFRIFFFTIRIRIMSRIRISLWNSLEKVILYMLKISTKFVVAPQSFCENHNSVQNQDKDQDHDISLDFNTRANISYIEDTHHILFGSANSFRSYFLHMKSPRTYRQTDRQTEIFFCLFCLLRHTNHEHLSKGEIFFLLMRLQYFLFLHTPYVMRK